MVLIRPFTAHYVDEARADPARFVSLPYDLITPAAYRRFLEQPAPHIMQVELPSFLTGPEREPALDRAETRLRRWLQEGILKAGAEAGFYRVIRQYRDPDGNLAQLEGLVGLLQIRDTARREVVPHENTHPRQVEQRMEYFTRLGLQSSPVFTIYRRDEDPVYELMRQTTRDREPLIQVETPGGYFDRAWAITDVEIVAKIQTAFMEVTPLLIADGHHRFEALRQLRMLHPDRLSQHQVLVFLANPAATDIRLLGYHRLLKFTRPPATESLLACLQTYFEVERTEPWERMEPLHREYTTIRPQERVILVSRESGTCYLLHLKPESHHYLEDPFDSLDVNLVNRFIFRECLAQVLAEGTETEGLVEYEADLEVIRETLAGGQADFAVLVGPIPLETLFKMGRAGRTAPPKSTFFYPKVPAGLVMSIDPSAGSPPRPE